MKISTALKTALLGTGSLDSVMSGFYIRIFKGPIPETADEALDTGTTHTLLAVLSESNGGFPGNPLTFGTAASGSIPKASAETWSGYIRSSGVGAGTATHVPTFIRVTQGETDTGLTLATTELRMQLTCGNVGEYEIYVPDMVDNGDGGAGDNVQGFSVFDVRVANT